MSEGKESVSLVVQHLVRPEARERYEAWLGTIMPRAAEAPGHLGVNVIRPVDGGRCYTIVIRHATFESADAWVNSSARSAFLKDIQDDLEAGDSVAIQNGIEFWFTPPPGGPPRKARPWKQWLLTTALIWPLTILVPWAYQPLLQGRPELAAVGLAQLLITATIVALVTWFLMPRAVGLLSGWLFR